MGMNRETRGVFSPRLKTLSVSLSLAMAGGVVALGMLGAEPAFATQKNTHFSQNRPTWLPKVAKSKFHHEAVGVAHHLDVQKVNAHLNSIASRPPRFDESKAGSVLQVTELSDAGEGSLRDALSRAHDGDVVDLSHLSGHVTLTQALSPASSVIIRGPGSDKLVLDGGGLDRVISSNHDLKISGVTLANGSVAAKNATGGCLSVAGYLYLANATISNCKAGGTGTQYAYGGAVYVKGELVMYDSTLTQNSVTAYQIAGGGGAFVRATGTYGLETMGSTISGNSVALDSSVNLPTSSYTFAFGGGAASVYVFGGTNSISNTLKYSTISNNTVSAPIVTLSGTTYGRTGGGGGAAFYGNQEAYVVGSTISGNATTVTGHGYGGGLVASYATLIAGSQLTGNTASSEYFSVAGGGSATFGETLLLGSVVSGNTATGACYLCSNTGGGIYAQAVYSQYSELSSNTVSETYAYGGALGGGFYSTMISKISESTISGNTASAYYAQYSYGGGAYAIATAEFDNSTVAFNTAGHGGGVELGDFNVATPSFTIQSSILSNNTASQVPASNDLDAFSAATVAGSNDLIMASSATLTLPADTLTSDPKLLPLANNGGLTRTHALDPTSPAIDAGSNPNGDKYDQRGYPHDRQFGAAPDIGAFEQDSDRIFHDGFETP